MTCPALVPLALCAALGGEPSVMATSSSRLIAAAPVMTPTAKYHRRHHYRKRAAWRSPQRRHPRAQAPAVCSTPPAPPMPRLVRVEMIRSPAAIVRAGFDDLRGAP